MTNDQDAANRFLNQLQEQAAAAEPPCLADESVTIQHIIINRPVRCTFVIGDSPVYNKPRRGA